MVPFKVCFYQGFWEVCKQHTQPAEPLFTVGLFPSSAVKAEIIHLVLNEEESESSYSEYTYRFGIEKSGILLLSFKIKKPIRRGAKNNEEEI